VDHEKYYQATTYFYVVEGGSSTNILYSYIQTNTAYKTETGFDENANHRLIVTTGVYDEDTISDDLYVTLTFPDSTVITLEDVEFDG